MQFGKEKEVEIFKALANKSVYKVGIQFGFDKVYKTPGSVRQAVNKIYNKIKNNPEEYADHGMSQEIVDMVQNSMYERKVAVVGEQPTVAEKNEETKDIKQLISGVRDKVWSAIDKKADSILNSKKKLNQISFSQLGTLAGIAFDKTQILKGEATENITVKAKISDDMSAEDAMALALRTREQNVEKNIEKG